MKKQATPHIWSVCLALIAGAALAILPAALDLNVDSYTGLFTGLGRALRALSVGGSVGNIGAWTILLVLSFLPALGLLWRGRSRADLLLLLSAGEIFSGLYFQVNPSLLGGAPLAAERWALTWPTAAAVTLLTWAVLRLLRWMDGKGSRGPALAGLMVAAAVLTAFLSALFLTENHISQLSSLAEVSGESHTRSILRLLWMLDLQVVFATGVLFLSGSRLVRALDDEPFSQSTLVLADSVALRCRRVTTLSLVIHVAGNLLQMVFFPHVSSVSVEVSLPMGLIVISLCLTLLCRYFRRAKAVNDDNASII